MLLDVADGLPRPKSKMATLLLGLYDTLRADLQRELDRMRVELERLNSEAEISKAAL